MLALLLFLAAPGADIEACANAVHTELASAVSACDASGVTIDLFKPGGMTDACLAAFKAGQQAGKYGPSLSEPQRAGLIREFDKRLAVCRAPKRDETKTRDTVQLWD
jgi:hypothetical protein